MSFLYDVILEEFGKREISKVVIPNYITDNLRPSFFERAYQSEAFKRFILCYNEEFSGKPKQPFHLLFNMATGSGKTFVMAGLILYLYEKGYRNFIFFVHSNNIITKTKDNFLNQQSSKYLFNDKITVDGREVLVKETNTFDGADDVNINIKFTTIQQLHLDLNNTKENSITYEDFIDRKIVLIADEAHHLNASTKTKGALFGGWEETVLEVLSKNYGNVLLEFTATLDYESREIVAKYQDKVLFKYDLSQFRLDKYSKEINLIRSLYDEQGRILQALILNLYRQEIATSHGINLKPVILFKAKKTIKESEENKQNFHRLIDRMSSVLIDEIRNTATVSIVQKAFTYFDSKGITSSDIANRLKSNFKVENCLSANSDDEAEKNQILLNTLEDENNPIRAVFAVHKLNEGWDVLNLFDIVRLYEGQNTGGSNKSVGGTTLSEAQLIGRGARYFPFAINKNEDRFKRKFDDDIGNDLKILEELYYHTKEDSRYISELKKALIETGIYEDEDKVEIKQLLLKEDFKKSDFYKTGQVYFNLRVERSYEKVKSFDDLGVSKKNFQYRLTSGFGKMTSAFFELEQQYEGEIEKGIDIQVSSIPDHIIRYALNQNPFFYFNKLEKFFPSLGSLSNFINNIDYLGGLSITFLGTKERLAHISNQDQLRAVQSLLEQTELELKSNKTAFQGSEFIKDYIHNIFRDKEIKVPIGDVRSDGQEVFLSTESWYVYNANYGTSEEKAFVKMFSRRFESLNRHFDEIYLIRNERELKIIDEQGRAFEPDFLLFCKKKGQQQLTYQVFIEPKGKHLMPFDKWKEELLMKIKENGAVLNIETDGYRITGIPFYNNEDENAFNNSLNLVLEL